MADRRERIAKWLARFHGDFVFSQDDVPGDAERIRPLTYAEEEKP